MCAMRWFLLKCFIFGVYISVTEGVVSLKTIDEATTYLIGSNVELICTITPYNNEMTWYVDNVPYAGCFVGTCGPSPNKPYTFNFTFDETAGVFNLKIDSVTSSHADLLFACDDGNMRESISFNVTTVNKPNESDRQSDNTVYIVLVVVVIVLISIGVVVVQCRTRPKFLKIELDETEIHFEWTARQNCCNKKCDIACKPNTWQVTDNSFQQPKFTTKKDFTLKRLNSMTIYDISLSRKLCCCLPTKRSVITRKSGVPDDQGFDVKSTIIDVRWTKPDCITTELKYKVTCNEEVKKDKYDKTNITLKDLIPGEMYKIEVFAIDKGTNRLLLAKEISTTPIQLTLEDVRYVPQDSYVKCIIKWTVENFDNPEGDNASDDFLFNVIWRTEKEQIHKIEKITGSSYTIPDLHPDRLYTVDVYAIYKSRPLEPHGKIQLTPYQPTYLDYTATSTEIEFNWKRPEYVGEQQLEYEVTCNEKKGKTTKETSFKLENLKPRQQYDIKIFTIINGMKSLPLQQKIRTIRPQLYQQESFPEVPIGNVHLVAR